MEDETKQQLVNKVCSDVRRRGYRIKEVFTATAFPRVIVALPANRTAVFELFDETNFDLSIRWDGGYF